MKKKVFFHPLAGIIAVISVSLFFAGCATTHSITFASAEQPDRGGNGPIMKYKHVAIKVRSHDSSVLERFYATHPNHKYQVVAYEKVNKIYWAPYLGGAGGLLTGLIGGVAGKGGGGFVIGLPIGLLIGSLIGYSYDGTYYVITYVER